MKRNAKVIQISDYLAKPKALKNGMDAEDRKIRWAQELATQLRDILSEAKPIGRDWDNDAERDEWLKRSFEELVEGIGAARSKKLSGS